MMITTVAQLIEVLGGTNAVAAICGVKFNAVSNWRVGDYLPDRHKYHLSCLCTERGLDVDEALFKRVSPTKAA